MSDYFVGLMSGTSMDGIDATLVEFDGQGVRLHHTHNMPWPDALRADFKHLASADAPATIAKFGRAHIAASHCFAQAVNSLLNQAGIGAGEITAIGSHGQTILHSPGGAHPFSLQIGDPGTLAALSGITVVADFRNTDIALGGQGAPLAPAFHLWAFGRESKPLAVVNIGGIANVTLLDTNDRVTGFDTGPGNTLLDLWCARHTGQPCDRGGAWAASGQVNDQLLNTMRQDGYFSLPAPKSTGTDYFNEQWLQEQLASMTPSPAPVDVQATLSELTAAEIARALSHETRLKHISICGGGVHNENLVNRLRQRMTGCSVASTDESGIPADWVEAIAFAWMARERLAGRPNSLPSVTGARTAASLGGVYLPGKDPRQV